MTARMAAEYTLNDNWTLFGRIENLFNVQYEDPAGFLRPGFGIYGGVDSTSAHHHGRSRRS